MIIDSPIVSGSFLSTGSLSQIGNAQITGSLTVSGSSISLVDGSFSGSGANLYGIPASGITGLNLSQIVSGSASASISPNLGLLINTSVSASNFTGSFTGSLTGIATSASYASFALTSSYSLGGSGFPFSGSAVITGSLIVSGSGLTITGSVSISTLTTGSGVRYVIADADGLISAQTASAVIFTTQQTIATAGQTVFPITNGYSTGYVTVFVNGSKLNEDEFTDTSGTNIVFATGSMVNDVVEFQKYLPASGVSNNTLRTTNYFTTTLGQTNFTVNYTPGLLDVFYNGSKLSNTEYTAANGTSITLATGSNAGDTVEVDVYSYQIGAFSGIGGSGVARELAFYNTSNSITGSNKVTYDGATFSVTGSFLVTGSSTFTNIGPAVFSGSVTAVGGFTGSFSGNADSASLAQNSLLLQGTGSVGFTTTASFLAVSSSQQQISSSYIALSASYNVYSSSVSTRITSDSSSLSSRTTQIENVYATTGSNTFTGVQNFSNTCTPNGFNSGASIYTAGGLQVTNDAYFSSSVFIKGNVTVYGTQSVAYISSSQLNIGTNTITVNTFTPSVRFGGLSVFDSGSTGLTGSIFWDSELNRWIYTNASGSGGGATYGGGMFISGPRNTQGLGCEQGTTACMLLVGQGGDHLTSSLVYHSSTVTCVPNNLIGSTICSTIVNASCIGIGTTSPATKLNIRSDAADDGILLEKSDGTDIARLFYDGTSTNARLDMFCGGSAKVQIHTNGISHFSGGNVGFCTTSPATRIGLNSYVGARLPYINGTNNTYDANGITVGNSNNGNTNIGGGLDMTNNCYCIGAYSPILSFSSVSSNYAYNNSYAGIWGVFQGAGGDANWNKGDLAFGTSVDYGIFERMRIRNSGEVGIGKIPDYKLDVYSSTTATQIIANFAAANYGCPSSRTYIQIGTQYGDGSSRIGSINTTGNQSALIFQSHAATSGVWNDAMYISGGGEVGIGTILPAVPLQIRDCSVSSGGSAINAYGYDGVADLYTTRGEDPYNAALYLHNNPIAGQGYGTGILFRAKSDTINSRVQGAVYTTWTTATDASRTSKMVFTTVNSGTSGDRLTILGNGNVGVGTGDTGGTICRRFEVYCATSGQSSNAIMRLTSGTNGAYGGETNFEFAFRDFGNSANYSVPAKIRAEYYEATGTDVSGKLEFYTKAAGGNDSCLPVLRMTISCGGNIGAPNGTNIYNASDSRLKRNVSTITCGINKVMSLNPVKFNWIEGFEASEQDKDMLGFVAQEVQSIIPEAVENFGLSDIYTSQGLIENPLRVNEKFIIPVLVKAIQEQQCTICSQASLINIFKTCLGIA